MCAGALCLLKGASKASGEAHLQSRAFFSCCCFAATRADRQSGKQRVTAVAWGSNFVFEGLAVDNILKMQIALPLARAETAPVCCGRIHSDGHIAGVRTAGVHGQGIRPFSRDLYVQPQKHFPYKSNELRADKSFMQRKNLPTL